MNIIGSSYHSLHLSGGTKAVNVTQKTTNRDYVGMLITFFFLYIFYPMMMTLAMLCILGKRQDEFVNFSIDPEENILFEWITGGFF
jgi:hypothetical protein